MSHFAILATIDQGQIEALKRIRPEHYRYLLANQSMLVFGGPTRTPEIQIPETMIIIVNAPDIAAAEAFIAAEPYNRNGCFSHVAVRTWSQVMPEAEPGALARTVEELERAGK